MNGNINNEVIARIKKEYQEKEYNNYTLEKAIIDSNKIKEDLEGLEENQSLINFFMNLKLNNFGFYVISIIIEENLTYMNLKPPKYLKTPEVIKNNGDCGFGSKNNDMLSNMLYDSQMKEYQSKKNRETIIIDILFTFNYIMNKINLNKECDKKSKRNLQRANKIIRKEFGSYFTSPVMDEIIKNHQKDNEKSIGNNLISQMKQISSGTFEYIEEIDKSNSLIEQTKELGFTREELQIYLNVLNIYIQNNQKAKTKQDYERPFLIEMPYFHKEVLGKSKTIRKQDYEKYREIFSSLSRKRIRITTQEATHKPYNSRSLRNVNIDSALIHADIMTYDNYKHQVVRLVPSAYTLFELTNIKQISNHLPLQFLKLKASQNDNIFYFGLYLTKMHRVNKKLMNNESRSLNKKINLETITVNAIPNHKEIIDKYNMSSRKKQIITKEIEEPLRTAIKILEDNKYMSCKIPKINYKKAFEETMLTFNFKYDLTTIKGEQ